MNRFGDDNNLKRNSVVKKTQLINSINSNVLLYDSNSGNVLMTEVAVENMIKKYDRNDRT